MAIKVKDIREKEFTKQYRGYSADEVDEFLDEIADQMELLIKEVKTLNKQLDEAQNGEAKPVEPAQPKVETAVAADDSSYFKNLREMLINAQRLADETVAEAKEKAAKIVADAESEAATKVVQAENSVVNAKNEYDSIVKKTNEYRDMIRTLLNKQMEVIEGK